MGIPVEETTGEKSTGDAEGMGPRIHGLRRPHVNLMVYYFLTSLILGPLFPLVLLPRYFRFRTLRYHFDERGVTMRWGVLFRREISLTYGRLQDIHLASNLFERWLGLAKVQLQTAAGSAAAEMVIEGLPEFEEVRDFLYSRMHGPRRHSDLSKTTAATASSGDEITRALQDTAAELRALRLAIAPGSEAESSAPPSPEPPLEG